jgi:hypothetical protein
MWYFGEISGSQGDEYEDVWYVAPCSLEEIYRRFRGAYCPIALMIEAINTFETSLNFYQTTRRNILEDSHFNTVL